ncbi:MAG: type II secretion system F family protein [Planctomycetota bacterium]
MAKKIQRKVPKLSRPTQARQIEHPEKRQGLLESRRVRPAALTQLTTQLATLLEAGIPVVRSLYILEGQMRPGVLKRTVADVAEDVEGGTPLSEALAKFPRVFDNLYTNMVRAGEAGGIQDTILNRLAGFMEKSETIKARVKGALAYPIAVVSIALVVMIVVMTFVVPEFEKIFKQLLRSDLPELTRLLVDTSRTVRDYWWTWGIGLPLLILIHHLLVRKIHAYHRFRDRTRLRTPLFGALIRKTIVSRFARTFGTLIESGVPHLEALDIVKASVRNVLLEEAVDKILVSIREGEGIARPMGESGIFDDLIVNMVDVGEQAGELDRMLIRIADRYEVEVDRSVDLVFKALEPILIVVLALFVGFVVFALLAPMMQLMQQMGPRR